MSQDLIQEVISQKRNESWWLESVKQVVGRYGQMFHPANLDRLTKEDFKSFLLFKNNLHWGAIHRQGNLVTADMPALIKFLKFVLDENIPIKERLKTNFTERGGYWIKGIGRAVITPILLVVYPTKYGVWNSRSENALRKLNLFPSFSPQDSFVSKYLKVNDVILDLSQKYNVTLWQLDGVLGEISGSGPFEAAPTEEEKVAEEVRREHGVEDVTNFGMESHLEDFLIANWSKTIFGKGYELIYNEGDLISQQYQTGVGPIDILAKSKNGEEYLVIELKKGRTSDAVVGQLLRYIAWVRENVANGKAVKGAVVVLDVDDKLKYALKELKDITLYTYQVNFNLMKEDLSNENAKK